MQANMLLHKSPKDSQPFLKVSKFTLPSKLRHRLVAPKVWERAKGNMVTKLHDISPGKVNFLKLLGTLVSDR